jgi:hypothetical protein
MSVQKVVIPLKKGINALFNYLKKMDASLRGNDFLRLLPTSCSEVIS